MAYAHITEFDSGDDRSTINYDAGMERINAQGQPDGLIHHSAGFDDNGVFRMYEVWQSSEQRQRFVKERLEPILAEGPVDTTRTDPPSREYGYELHYTSPYGHLPLARRPRHLQRGTRAFFGCSPAPVCPDSAADAASGAGEFAPQIPRTGR